MLNYLFITQSDLATEDSNGRTLREVFDYVNGDNIFCFCTVRRNNKLVKENSFCIRESRLFKKKKIHFDASQDYSKNIIGNAKIKKNPLTCILRNALWNVSFVFWKNKYKKWIKKINPDVIVFNPGDFLFMHKIACYTSKVLKKKIVIYNTEDYIFKTWNYLHKENGFSFLFPCFRRKLKKSYMKSFNKSYLIMHNTEGLTKEYSLLFPKLKHLTIFHPSKIKPEIKVYDSNAPLLFYYCGALDKGRGDIMLNFAKMLDTSVPSAKIIINGLAKRDFSEKLQNFKNIEYEGFVPYNNVVEKLNNSFILLSINSMDEYNSKDKKHGFSTKISDYIASLNIIFHIGPQGDETDTLENYHLGYVSKNEKEILINLDKLANVIQTNGVNPFLENQKSFYKNFLNPIFVSEKVKSVVEIC